MEQFHTHDKLQLVYRKAALTKQRQASTKVIQHGCVRVQNYGGDLNAVSPCDETKCCVREVAVYNIDSQSAQPCAPFFDWENTNYVWWDNTCPTNLPIHCFDACKFDIYNSLDPTQYP